MSAYSNTRSLNHTLNGDTINTSQISTTRPRRTMAPTRQNQRLSISADGTITTHTRTFESELRSMFSRLGAELSNERRNGRFINPITNRAITIRDNTDIRRLERRMLARSRFNAAQTPPAPQTARINFTEVRHSPEYNFGVYKYITPSTDPELRVALLAIEAQNGGRRIDRARIVFKYGDDEHAVVQTKILELSATEDYPDTLDDLVAQFESCSWMESFGVMVGIDGVIDLTITIHAIGTPPGEGASCSGLSQVPEYLRKMKGISLIFNNDELCGQRCLVLSMQTDSQRKNLLKPVRATQLTRKASDLADQIGVTGSMRFPDDFDKFTTVFPDYGIYIFDGIGSCCHAANTEAPNRAMLFYDRKLEHYHLMLNPDPYRLKKVFCYKCAKFHPIESSKYHVCGTTHRCPSCRVCFDTKEGLESHKAHTNYEQKRALTCTKCNHWNHSDECAQTHSTFCKGLVWFCLRCKQHVPINEKEEHEAICGQEKTIKCKCCNKWVPTDHRCSIQSLPAPDDALDKRKSWYAFDFETDITGAQHIVNAAGWQRLDLGNEDAEKHDYRCQYERGESSVAEFVRFAVSCKNTTFIAHNGSGYDFLLVAEEIVKQTGKTARKIRAGGKVMRMDFKSVRFIDSCRHITTRLANFPKTFGLGTSVRKGHFPYQFNTMQNIGYTGQIPDKEHFLTARMSKQDFSEFNDWYDEVKDTQYDLEVECRAYTENDVLILKLGLEAYVEASVAATGLNSLDSTTVAGAVQKEILTHYLKPETPLAVLSADESKFVRRGFFGGRTEIFNDCFELTPEQIAVGWRIGYHDVVSEYPTVMYYTDLPYGHPEIIDSAMLSECEIKTPADCEAAIRDAYCGFAEVDITPSRELIHPVLAEKGAKLTFNLNAKVKQVYTICELMAALDRGYKITRIYEIQKYKHSKEMFKEFINVHLKGKIESNGRIEDPEKLAAFKVECKERYGFDIDDPVDNPGRKAISKLSLNTSWGKFAQSTENTMERVCDPKQWADMLRKHKQGLVRIKNEALIGSKMHVTYTDFRESENGNFRRNVALAAYVTAQARLWLLNGLETVGSYALGCDTDSVMYALPPGKKFDLPCGKHLGEWEDEFDASKVAIGWVSSGKKTYAFKFANDKEKLAAKGVTLHRTNAEKVDYDSMKALVLGETDTIGGLMGPAMKRRKISETQGHAILNADDANDASKNKKRIRRTHTTRVRVAPVFAHMYPPRFMVPFGHIHGIGIATSNQVLFNELFPHNEDDSSYAESKDDVDWDSIDSD